MTVSGPQLLSLRPFGPLPDQPWLYSPPSLPFRASALPAFGCLPFPGCCNYCGTPSTSTQEHTPWYAHTGEAKPQNKDMPKRYPVRVHVQKKAGRQEGNRSNRGNWDNRGSWSNRGNRQTRLTGETWAIGVTGEIGVIGQNGKEGKRGSKGNQKNGEHM